MGGTRPASAATLHAPSLRVGALARWQEGRQEEELAHERPGSAAARVGQGSAPVDRVQLYGSEPAVDLRTINGRANFHYTRTKRLPLTEDRGEYLQIEPAVIHFEGFLNLGQKHFARVQISNVSGATRKIHVLPAQSRFFVVHSGSRRKLAPGLCTHVQIVFTPLEKRSYYDCIRIKTDDGQREYLLPLHAYPGRRMVLEHVPAPLPPRANNWTQVQDVWRLEQFALTAVDQLRGSLSKARIKIADMPEVRGGQCGKGKDGEKIKEQGPQQDHRRALDEMQAEMMELEREIFLGPGVEMGPSIFVGSPGAASQERGGFRSPGRVSAHLPTSGVGGRGQTTDPTRVSDPFEMPFDYPMNPHPRGTPTPTPTPWQYVPASTYVPLSTRSPREKAAGAREREIGRSALSASAVTPGRAAKQDASVATLKRASLAAAVHSD